MQTAHYYVFFSLWIVSAMVSSCYTFYWDIRKDWGLFEGKHKLREELIYPNVRRKCGDVRWCGVRG